MDLLCVFDPDKPLPDCKMKDVYVCVCVSECVEMRDTCRRWCSTVARSPWISAGGGVIRLIWQTKSWPHKRKSNEVMKERSNGRKVWPVLEFSLRFDPFILKVLLSLWIWDDMFFKLSWERHTSKLPLTFRCLNETFHLRSMLSKPLPAGKTRS